jgi:hypothetical protein
LLDLGGNRRIAIAVNEDAAHAAESLFAVRHGRRQEEEEAAFLAARPITGDRSTRYEKTSGPVAGAGELSLTQASSRTSVIHIDPCQAHLPDVRPARLRRATRSPHTRSSERHFSKLLSMILLYDACGILKK